MTPPLDRLAPRARVSSHGSGLTTPALEAPATARVALRPVVLIFLAMTVAATVLVNVGARLVDYPPSLPLWDWLEPWVRYDSGWYQAIAVDGYYYREGVQSPVAFFPTYPLLMRAGGAVIGVYLSGVILTILAGLTSVLLFTRWASARMSRRATVTALALLLVYPYSLYLYGAVYADALFLACALGAFVLLERGHPWLAGLVGALASAGRPVGVALVIALAVRAVELAWRRNQPDQTTPTSAQAPATWLARVRRGLTTAVQSLRYVRLSDAGVLLAGTGLAAYMAYQWLSFGNPIAFVATESSPGWDQGSGPRVLFKVAFFGTMLHGSAPEIARLLVPAVLLLGTVLLLPRIVRRFGWGYAVYTAVVIAIPIVGTKDFMGCGRYLLVAFPAFAAAGQLLGEKCSPWVRTVILSLSATLLAVAALGYGLGYEVS